MKRRLIASLSVAALSLAGLQARAAVVVSNLDPADYDSSTNFYGQDLGESITTGSEAISLTSVVIAQLDGPAPGQTFGVYTRYPGGDPGGELYGGFTMAFDSTTDQTTETVSKSFVLAANTSYWFILESPGYPTSVTWNYSTTTDYSSEFGASLPGDQTVFVNNGTRSTYYSLSAGYGPLVFDVNGVPVPIPEPSAAAFVGLALAGGLVGLARRRAVVGA
jgi:hypothetical protein